MNGFWTGAGTAQQVVIAAASAWNALDFTRRVRTGSRSRQVAAGLLALLFVGVALEAAAGVPVGASIAQVLWRTPLLLATTGIAWLVSYRPRPHQEAHHSTHHTGGAR